MAPNQPTPGVLHYLQTWLEPSEQFVHATISRSRYPHVVVASRNVVHRDRFPITHLHRLGWIEHLPGESTKRRARTATLLALAGRHRAGLVHVHFGYRLAEVAGLVSRRQLPLVASLHGHDATAWADLNPLHYRDMAPLLDRVIVPSAWFGSVVEGLGVPSEVIRVAPVGVDTGWFRPSAVPDAPVVLFVGRFVEKKGVDVLVRAWPLVRAAVPTAELRLCGYGPLRSLASRAGAGVTIVDRPDRSQVRDEMAAARVVVSPSRTGSDGDVETLLVVNLEAQASGRPLVTTRHGGIPEYVVDGETALLVAEGDVGGLADALIAVLEDDALAQRLGSAGPRHVAQWDLTPCVERVDRIYDELLGA